MELSDAWENMEKEEKLRKEALEDLARRAARRRKELPIEKELRGVGLHGIEPEEF